MPTTIQLKRGNSSSIASSNPVLAAGEICVELDTGKFKIGDGSSEWGDLPYVGSVSATDITDSTPAGRALLTTVTQVPTGNMIVAGAGDENVNAIYIPGGEVNGKPFYNHPDITELLLSWDGRWIFIFDGETFLYQDAIAANVTTPDLVTTWETVFGDAPAPTVTAETRETLIAASQITDASDAGRALLTAADAEAQADLLAPFISGGLDSSAVILAQAGDDLLAKYTAAKALTPNGSAKSATNRAALVIMPGTYALSATLTLDADFVDVIGLGATEKNPAVILTTNSISCTNTAAKDYRVSGISVGTQAFGVAGHSVASADKRVFTNCTGGNYSYGMEEIASSQFINCVGGTFSFGAGYASTTSGIFINCVGGNFSFGSNESGSITSSALFDNCVGGGGSFGIGAFNSGTFRNCTGGDNSFGGEFSEHLAPASFEGCYGGAGSFGANSSSGKYLRCQLPSGPFPTTYGVGWVRLCITDSTEVNTGP
jgi:hypothetical protein